MKYVSILAVSFWLMASGANAEMDVNLKRETLDLLDESMSRYHKKLIEKMPDEVRLRLASLDKPKSIYELKDTESILWFHNHVKVGGDEELIKSVEKLRFELAVSGDKIHGDDVGSIFESSFFATWNKEDFDLKESIVKFAIYWRERTTPAQQLSPDGMNPIGWHWQLDVESREDGVMHVGIDQKKRTFICYEHTVGIYFPEGETLERIYREIVQNPDMAGEFVGKGRKKTE
ncbi:MAG: hypothetical protein EOP06_21935 [Proteobacteria bacterium]|nr:MAG: hypothetical protein EOP06_21935 [Pseudomonadota bacterium]